MAMILKSKIGINVEMCLLRLKILYLMGANRCAGASEPRDAVDDVEFLNVIK